MTTERPIRTAWHVFRSALKGADQHGLPRLGAALAFYTLFSLAPLLYVVITGASLLLERTVVRQEIRDYATTVLGPQAAQAIMAVTRNASVTIPNGPQAVFSVLVFFLGSTAAFNALLGTLNHIWDVEETGGSIIWRIVRRRLIAFGLVLAVGLLGLVSLAFTTALTGLRSHYPELLTHIPMLASRLTNLLVGIALLMMLFALIYRVVPDAELRWQDVFVGAAFTSLFFSVGTIAIGEYIGKIGIQSVFGAASSVVLLLFWVYYSAQVFLFGAEVTYAYGRARDGAAPRPQSGQSSSRRPASS